MQKVLGKSFEKRVFMDNLASIFLILDEIVDGGYVHQRPIIPTAPSWTTLTIMCRVQYSKRVSSSLFLACRIVCETDSRSVIQRASIRTEEQQPLGEQTVAQVLLSAKEQLKWSLLK